MPTAREALLNAAFRAVGRRPWGTVRMVDVAAAAGVSRQTLYNEFGNKDGLARALVRRETEAYLRGVEQALAPGEDARDPADRLAAAAAWTVRVARGNALVRAALTGCWNDRLPAAAFGPRALPAQRHPIGAASVEQSGEPAPPAPLSQPGQPGQRGRSHPPGLSGQAGHWGLPGREMTGRGWDGEGAWSGGGARAGAPGPGDALPSPGELMRQVGDRCLAALCADRPALATAELAWACEAAARLAISYVSVPGAPDEAAALVRRVLAPRWTAGQQAGPARR
ncbi:TetR/AcrR family transcriptional regulator [Streptomyces sp. AC563]|uniref:TetR/AcrR family transcriptional regulator n=1 Tax=Streptomyces buecherae TaxID=2763006 RepID=UPI00164D1569|nr:TetR/AcrR family transcriptional regulator [Streptomyces buecherae]MBC3988698.1 TetR/AcrR family transcriptional regulator [Streptomyces buecherae]